jgi:hypothetical protein
MANSGTQTNFPSRQLSPADDRGVYELGAWAAGLESYLTGGGGSFGEKGAAPNQGDHKRELNIARGTLQRCANLAFKVLATARHDVAEISGVTFDELRSFSAALRDVLLLTGTIARADSVSVVEWNAWCRTVTDRFGSEPSFAKLTSLADNGGADYLPERLRGLIESGADGPRAEFQAILPRFGRILRLLNIVREMLDADEPLKPTLLIFSKVSEQTQELIRYLNHRIERSAGGDPELIGSLDGASYTASIELKKVVNQELAGLAAIRPSTTVYARTEAAHALLSESFQQILTGFARQFDPSVDAFDLFANFGEKLEHSLTLRADLYRNMKLVQAAEKDPDNETMDVLNESLTRFLEDSMRFLFYKDTETFERFVEEIRVTRLSKDLVPILHRFGAYLETLAAQVSMRAVLEQHPFVPPA